MGASVRRWKNRRQGLQDGDVEVLKDIRDLGLIIAEALCASTEAQLAVATKHLTDFARERREDVPGDGH